jgi:hypothetical protein
MKTSKELNVYSVNGGINDYRERSLTKLNGMDNDRLHNNFFVVNKRDTQILSKETTLRWL